MILLECINYLHIQPKCMNVSFLENHNVSLVRLGPVKYFNFLCVNYRIIFCDNNCNIIAVISLHSWNLVALEFLIVFVYKQD